MYVSTFERQLQQLPMVGTAAAAAGAAVLAAIQGMLQQFIDK